MACYGLELMTGGWNSYWQRILALIGLYVTLSVSLNLINGITGQFSIGHAAFYQVGAYLSAYLSVTYYAHSPIQGIPWLLLMVLAGAAGAAVAGLVVGLPSLRLRGDYLAIVTMGFGEIIRIFLNNLNAPINLTNGPQGINHIDPVDIGGLFHTWFRALGIDPTDVQYGNAGQPLPIAHEDMKAVKEVLA